MRTFEPPKDSPVLISLAQLLAPAVIRVRHGDTHLEIVDDGLERFKRLKGKRTIICPNHPSEDDADIIFAFSRAVRESFNIMTAWELFHARGINQQWLQHLGCFSIIRGAPDYASFRATRDLIVEGRKKVVIFPEGEISHDSDALLPLKPGAVQIGLAALDKLARQGRQTSVYILPLAIKYVYRTDVRDVLESCTSKLEEQLGITAPAGESLYNRLRRVAHCILFDLEKRYGYTPEPNASLNERISGLRSTVLRQVAANIGVELPPGGTQLEWAETLLSRIYDLRYAKEPPGTSQLKEEAAERAEQLRSLARDLHRVINFIGIYEGQIKDPATQEQLAELIDLFEEEVLGHRTIKGPRSVVIDVGGPLDLLEFHEEYKRDKANTVRRLTQALSSKLTLMLRQLDARRKTFYVTSQSESYQALSSP